MQFSSKYGREKVQKLKEEMMMKENALRYKYAEEDEELRERATLLHQENASYQAQLRERSGSANRAEPNHLSRYGYS